MAGGANKGRWWEVIVYPESAPADWRERLRGTKLPYLIGPLHDKDKKKDGELKKPHYHVMVCYGNATTLKCIQDGVGVPVAGSPHTTTKVYSPDGEEDYLDHHKEPEKAQYDRADYEYGNGMQEVLENYKKNKPENKKQDEVSGMKGILKVCKEQGFREFSSLVDWLMENGDDDALELLMRPGAGNLIYRYLSSVRFALSCEERGRR